jgi:hypothetical protein
VITILHFDLVDDKDIVESDTLLATAYAILKIHLEKQLLPNVFLDLSWHLQFILLIQCVLYQSLKLPLVKLFGPMNYV